MKYLLLVICLTLLFLGGCDNRAVDKPILIVIPSTQSLYNVANHDTVYIACQMTGANSLIANKKINVIYNSVEGLFIGSGTDNYLMTDNQGYAQGLFKVHDGFYGNILLKFSPEHFPEQAKSINLDVKDMPSIHIFAVSDSTLTSGELSSDITVTLTSHSQNISNQWIHFTTSIGTNIDSLIVKTNSLGTAHNVFHRNVFIGEAYISAFVEIHPEDIRNLTVHCQ